MKAKLYRRQKGAACWLLLFLALALGASCGGSLYRVKPVVDAPVNSTIGAASAGGVNVRAVPLMKDEEGQELFEANLLLAGLLPVRVEIANESGAPLVFKRVRFRLRDALGKEWKYRNAKQAVSRILEANDIYLYNPNSRAAFEAAFRAHALDLETPLAAGQPRRGLIFFQTPKKDAVEGQSGLVLVIQGLPQPLELRLN
ncbi:MAG TPA: hypothetical protein VF658_21695 [Pyrinomonadaceae bacterium]